MDKAGEQGPWKSSETVGSGKRALPAPTANAKVDFGSYLRTLDAKRRLDANQERVTA
jgi:hypothetical protein